MGLIKFILLLLVLFAAFTLWRQWQAGQAAKRRPPEPDKPPLMVRCAHCGLHLPEHQAIRQDSEWFCSRDHLEADRDA